VKRVLSAEPQPCSGEAGSRALEALSRWSPPACPDAPVLEHCFEIGGYAFAVGGACGVRLQVAVDAVGGEAEESRGWATILASAGSAPPLVGERVQEPPEPLRLMRASRGYTGLATLWETGRGPALLRARRRAVDSPLEPVLLAFLAGRGFESAPRLYSYTVLDGETYSVYREWVPGTPLAELAWSSLREALGLLGRTLRRLHATLAACGDPLCSPEPSGGDDAERWLFRLEYRASLASKPLALDPDAVEALEKLAADAGPLAEAASTFERQRLHGDPHLYNAIYTRGRVVLVDFSGEPHREPASPLEKEPPQRDLAVVLRSLHYYHHMRGEGYPEGALPLIEGYGACNSPLEAQALAFWLVERASYELVYEALARTGLESVPAAALRAMVRGLDPLYAALSEGRCPGG
jgi:Ser/Thr protein kinase RdoA (MazF antagonist)